MTRRLPMALLAVLISCSNQAGKAELPFRPGRTYATIVNGVKVFVADRGGRAVVFVNSAQHLPGELVWWCPNEKVFVSPSHGELFDADGRYLAGPASRDLDRVRATGGADGTLALDLKRVQRGRARSQPDTFEGLSPDLKTRYLAWASRDQGAPTSFCRNHVAG